MAGVAIHIHVPYKPTPQQRHRHTRNGRAYDPCCQMKRDFLQLCMLAKQPPDHAYRKHPIECSLVFTFARPKSHTTPKGVLKKQAPVKHVFKPDTDNLAKFAMDALNGVYYHDDSQIHCLQVRKQYGDEDSVRIVLVYST